MSTLESAPRSMAQSSVIPAMRGVPWWGAVLIALIPAVVGGYLDLSNHPGALTREAIGTNYAVLLCVGCGLAALVVRRIAVFTAMVQPPLVAVAGITLALLIDPDAKIGIAAATVYVAIFPAMVIATAIGLVIGAIRLFTQPLRRTRHR